MQAMQKRVFNHFLSRNVPSISFWHRAECSRSEITTLAGLMNLPFCWRGLKDLAAKRPLFLLT